MNEVWKPIAGYEGLYEISSIGRVKSLGRTITDRGHNYRVDRVRVISGRILRQTRQSVGYLCVRLCSSDTTITTVLVHRLVAKAFLVSSIERNEVNHINGDKKDNRVCNLEWCTHAENQRHAFSTGLVSHQCGSQKGSAKLNEAKVADIKRMIAAGMTNVDIAKLYGVSTAPISYIRTGKAWTHVA
jgi:hypothetical protein